MKKFITLIAAAAAMLAVSCNKENAINDGSTPGVLTATFEQTKVSYTENGDNLQPAWEVDDKIIGFDAAGNTYTFTVTEVKSTTATLSADKTIADGAYHLIFKAGAQASDISDKSIAVSYDGQSGDKTMPAVMLADGTVTEGGCNFTFSNAGAIVGISAINGVPENATISKITVEGENLSGATVALDGSALKLTATAKTGDAVSTATLSGITADAQGQLKKGGNNTIIYVAVPAGAVIAKVSATVGSDTYTYTLAAAKTATAGSYLYVRTQEFDKDSSLPAGALPGVFTVSNDDGTTKTHIYFSQGNLWYGKVDDAQTATFNFEANQYGFKDSWDEAYVSHFYWSQSVNSAIAEEYDWKGSVSDVFFTNETETTAKANFTVNVGGTEQTGWRTLSTKEWQYLFNTRTVNGGQGAGKSYSLNITYGGKMGLVLYPDDYDKDPVSGTVTDLPDGVVFLPAAGRRGGSNISDVGSGYYWSSSTADDSYGAYSAFFGSSTVNPGFNDGRDGGYSVRLVTEGGSPAPSVVPVDLSQIINSALSGKSRGETATVTLSSSNRYTLATAVDAGLVNIIINGNGAKVTLADSTQIAGQQRIEINNVNFDCAANTKLAPIALSAAPDSDVHASKGNFYGNTQNVFVDTCAIVLNGCNFSLLPTSLVSNNGAAWILGGLTINNCVVQFSKSDTKPYINFYEAPNNVGAIKNFTINASTLFNISIDDAYFIRFANASNGQASKAFPADPYEYITFTNNTFVNICTEKNFGNNTMNNAAFVDEIKGNVFFNVYRLNKYLQTNNTYNFTAADNAINGDIVTIDGTDKSKIATEDTLLALTLPVGALDFNNISALKVNFAPTVGSYAAINGFGDPRWK